MWSVQSKLLGLERTERLILRILLFLQEANWVITEELGMNLDNVELDMLGSCKEVTISKDDTIVLDGAGDKKAIEERCGCGLDMGEGPISTPLTWVPRGPRRSLDLRFIELGNAHCQSPSFLSLKIIPTGNFCETTLSGQS